MLLPFVVNKVKPYENSSEGNNMYKASKIILLSLLLFGCGSDSFYDDHEYAENLIVQSLCQSDINFCNKSDKVTREQPKTKISIKIDSALANHFGIFGLRNKKAVLGYLENAVELEDTSLPKDSRKLLKKVIRSEAFQLSAFFQEEYKSSDGENKLPVEVTRVANITSKIFNLMEPCKNLSEKTIDSSGVNACFKFLANNNWLNLFTLSKLEPHKLKLNKDLLSAALKKVNGNVNLTEIHAYKVSEWLMDSGAKLNSKPTHIGSTPLIESINQRHFTLANYFIEKGADVNQASYSSKTGLIDQFPLLALFEIDYSKLNTFQINQYDKLWKSLVNSNIDWTVRTPDLMIEPLIYAAKNGHVNAFQYAQEKGLDLDKKRLISATKNEEVLTSPIEVAMGSSHPKIVNYVMSTNRKFTDLELERAFAVVDLLNTRFAMKALANFSADQPWIQ
jgi:ankyrin repeat protein